MRGLTLNSPALVAAVTPVSAGSGPPVPLDFTTSNTGTAPRAVTLPTYSVGDLLVTFCMVDYGTGSSPSLPTAGPNGETVKVLSGMQGLACYFIATDSRSGAVLNYTGGSGFQTNHTAFRVAAGTFNTVDPIYNVAVVSSSATTAVTPAWTSVLTTGIELIVGIYETSAPSAISSGWTQKLSNDFGAIAVYAAQSDTTTTGGAEASVTITKAALRSTTSVYVLNPVPGSVPGAIIYSPSTNYTQTSDGVGAPGFKVNSFYLTGLAGVVSAFPVSPPGNGGSEITGIKVEYKRNIDSTWLVATTNATTLPFSFAVPEGNQSYNIRVSLINSLGTSTLVQTFPNVYAGLPPEQVASTYTVTAKSGYIAFTNITNPSSVGSSITNYKIRYRVSGSGTWLDAETQGMDYFIAPNGADAGDRSGYLFGLTNSTTYEVALAAVNSYGTGPYSTTYTVTPVLSAAHANDGGSATYTEYPLRVWALYPQDFDSPATGNIRDKTFTSVDVGTEIWSGDSSGTYCYHVILEYDTSTQSGGITAGNTLAPVVALLGTGTNWTIEAWTAHPSFNPIMSARSDSDTFTKTEMASYTYGASKALTGLTGNQTLTKNGFNFGAVSGGSAKTYVILTSANHRTGTSFDGKNSFNPWLCPLSFKVA